GEKAAPGERPRLNYTDGGGRLQENGRGGQGGGPRRLARCLERQRNKAKPKVEQGTRNVEGRRLLCPSTFDIPCSLFDILFGVLRFRGLRMIPWGLRGRPGSGRAAGRRGVGCPRSGAAPTGAPLPAPRRPARAAFAPARPAPGAAGGSAA